MLIEELEKEFLKIKFEKESLEKQVKQNKENLNLLQQKDNIIENLQKLSINIIKEIQKNLKFEIENLINSFIQTTFPDKDYIFQLEFVERRNKTEVDFLLIDKDTGKIFNPLEENGGGLVDLLAFALRIAFLTITNYRNLLIFDEPLKFLDKDKKYKVAKLLKELSQKLNLQFLIVTHDTQFIEEADNVIEIK